MGSVTFFPNLLGGGTIKFQSGKRFGHRCGPSSVPDFFKNKNIKALSEDRYRGDIQGD